VGKTWRTQSIRKPISVFVDVAKHTFSGWVNDNVSRLAAALAFYTIFSLAPVLLIALAVAGAIVGNEAAREELVRELSLYIGSDGTTFVLTILDQARGSMAGQTATLIGLATTLFGATIVFAELQSALNQVWNVRVKRGVNLKHVIYSRLLSFVTVLIVALLLLLSVVLSAAVSAINSWFSDKIAIPVWLLAGGNFVISFLLITIMFAVLFKVLPDVKIGWRDVAVGAVFTSLLFTVGKMLIGLYLSQSSLQSLYGAAGSFVIILAWVYYSSQVFFFGAELCQVWSARYGSGIIPNRYAELDSCPTDNPNGSASGGLAA
jgi:membrane protein